MTPTLPPDIEKEFDKKFKPTSSHMDGLFYYSSEADRTDEVKAFIATALENQRAEILIWVEDQVIVEDNPVGLPTTKKQEEHNYINRKKQEEHNYINRKRNQLRAEQRQILTEHTPEGDHV